jgi:hypothetical protein
MFICLIFTLLGEVDLTFISNHFKLPKETLLKVNFCLTWTYKNIIYSLYYCRL